MYNLSMGFGSILLIISITFFISFWIKLFRNRPAKKSFIYSALFFLILIVWAIVWDSLYDPFKYGEKAYKEKKWENAITHLSQVDTTNENHYKAQALLKNSKAQLENERIEGKENDDIENKLLESIGTIIGILIILLIYSLFIRRGTYKAPRKERIDEREKLRADLKSDDNSPRFSALYPYYVIPDSWYSLIIYIWLPKALKDVQRDFAKRKELLLGEYTHSNTNGSEYIKHDTKITIIPELIGCQFNPSFSTLLWLEDWHCIEFRMKIKSVEFASDIDRLKIGRIAYYVGPILIAETKMEIQLIPSNNINQPKLQWDWDFPWTEAFRNIFVSYSHNDKKIIDKLENAYRVLGDRYMRDVRMLRSGQEWETEIIRFINMADIFQLCWSHSASLSKYVENEWRHAYGLKRKSFIRPIYWEVPMPLPPQELSNIHFAFLEI